MNISSLSVGQKIELNDGRTATICFLGATSFQTGDWVGVELEEDTGKNDGSVKGERYFECPPGCGMFLRASGVRQVLQDVSRAKTVGNGARDKSSRPSSLQTGANGVKRQSLAESAGKRSSAIIGSPTPGARAGLTGIRSPVKSPVKQLGSNGISSSSTSRTSTPPVANKPASATAPKARSSLAPSSSTNGRRTSAMPPPPVPGSHRTVRPSLGPPAAGQRAPPPRPDAGRSSSVRGPTGSERSVRQQMSTTNEETRSDQDSERPDLLSPKESEPSSQASQSEAGGELHDEDDTVRPNFAPPPPPPEPPQGSPPTMRPGRPSSPAAASIHSQRTIRSTAASSRQIEELEVKVKVLERKRMEDRGLKGTLEKAQQERDQYKGIIEKLQNKYRPQQQELADLKRALEESEKKFVAVESLQAEHDTAMEMATLDREMAEETAEGLKAELEALRQHNEEMQLELDILREENDELSKEMSPDERSSAGWMQLQNSNERLRNALLALRDRSMDEKEELKDQIGGLEDQLKDLDALRGHHEEAREKLLRSEAETSDLRQQLEVALQADEMIEELTERNGRLDATVDELRAAIDDLENIRELNDELEVNHMEAEKQMQEEIDFKDSLLVDRERTAKLQQEALDERDYTLTRFRALVSTLQDDMADMKASKQLTEAEAKDLEGKSRAMLDLNMKLQSSAAKTQVKTLDLELRKLEADEASEHLAIVQLFLPEAFHAERDSVLALLRFKRIVFKSNLVHGFVKERVASFGARGADEDVFAACSVLDKLTWIAAMASRFVNSVSACNIEEFASYQSALYELEPVERALNSYIDGLRREEVKERDMAEELQRSIAVMSHLASLHIKDDLASLADDLLMRTLCLQSQLESAATALQLSRTMVETYVRPSSDDEEEDEASTSDLDTLLSRASVLMNQARSAKVMAGKTNRSLADLQARSLTLEASCTESLDSAESITMEVVTYTRQAGEALQTLFGEEGRNEPFPATEVASTLSRAATSVFKLEAPEAGPLTALKSRLQNLSEALTELTSISSDLDNTVEFERTVAPWIARANELKQRKLISIDTEAELARTFETLRGKDAVLKEKETELEEQSVRIEMLDARLKDASKRSAKIAELERSLHEAHDATRKARRDVERAREEKEREAERVRDELGRLGEERRKAGASEELGDDAMGAGAKMTVKRQEYKISSLEGAVRFLKEENHRLRLPPPDSPLSVQAKLNWLHDPVVEPKSEHWKRHENLQKEGKDLLQQMLSLASRPHTVDLTRRPENKLAWRSRKESSRWQVAALREEWEALRERRERVMERGMQRAPKTMMNGVRKASETRVLEV